MPDEQTNQTDTQGTPTNTDTPNGQEDISELDKLKASNDEIEKELIRGRELRAEGQKLEAEKMRGGKTSAGQTNLTAEEEIQKKGAEEAQEIVDAFR